MPVHNESGSCELFAPVTSSTWPWSRRFNGQWGFSGTETGQLPESPRSLLDAVAREILDAESAASTTPEPYESTISGGETISDSDLSELAIQTWRLQNRIDGLDPEEHKRIRKQLMDSARRFAKILQRFDVEFEDVTGQPYSRGWQEVEVVSWEEQGDETSPVEAGPWVRSTVSPIIRRKGKTVKLGQVVCVEVDE
jgi:hypothetical protein